ncbi:MAG: aldehyde ferredoxin oxidoreductase C-terminal domain-containing protein [bacterium]
MHGFHGNYLSIDLGDASARKVPLPREVLRAVLGGVGLGSWLLLKESGEQYDPLAPEAPLVVAFAPLAGTALNTSAKAAVVSKSPLTGRLNDAMLSSGFALSGKATGSDALVVKGACREWSTLFVEPEGISLRPTPHLTGLSAQAGAEQIRREWGEDWMVLSIGVAGENLVPYALLSHDGRHAGRGGSGAVFGAKKLKAIAVKGGCKTTVADEERFAQIRARLREKSLGHATEKYRTTGTLGNLLVFNRLSVLPTRNFQQSNHPRAEELSAEQLFSGSKVSRTTCADCMIGCEKRLEREGGGSVRLEYENVFALGSLLDIWDSDAVLEGSRLCDEFGLDTITLGGTLAFAMECVEKGLCEIPGMKFGNGKILLEAVEKIARREGYGELLALGSRAMARRIGKGSEALAVQVKGLELPGYHPARLQTLGLGFAVGPRGADHNKSSAYDLDLSGRVDRFGLDGERISEMVAIEDQAAIIDSLILCKFVRRALGDFFAEAAEMLTALTGERFSAGELRASAATIHDLKKIFNQRQGWGIDEDMLPPRFFRGAEQGPAAGNGSEGGGIEKADFLAARQSYYLKRGWNAQGRLNPNSDTLRALGVL